MLRPHIFSPHAHSVWTHAHTPILGWHGLPAHTSHSTAQTQSSSGKGAHLTQFRRWGLSTHYVQGPLGRSGDTRSTARRRLGQPQSPLPLLPLSQPRRKVQLPCIHIGFLQSESLERSYLSPAHMDGRHIIRFRYIIRYLFEFRMRRLNLSGHLRVLSQPSPCAR